MNEQYNELLTGISEKERHLLISLLQQGKQTVRARDLITQLRIDKKAAHVILSRLAHKGWLQRLLPGVYGFVPLSADSPKPIPEDALALAMELFNPCYITGWSAAEHWDLTEQVFNSVSLCSTQKFRTKTVDASGIRYYVQHVSEDKLFGLQKLWQGSLQVTIADPHRTIIDILNNLELGAGGRLSLSIIQAYWKNSKVDFDLLFEYAQKMHNGTIFKRLGFTAERFGKPTEEWLKKCAQKITKGVSKFDPAGSDSGIITTRWNLKMNVPIEESR